MPFSGFPNDKGHQKTNRDLFYLQFKTYKMKVNSFKI
jgi:hypothetical protein